MVDNSDKIARDFEYAEVLLAQAKATWLAGNNPTPQLYLTKLMIGNIEFGVEPVTRTETVLRFGENGTMCWPDTEPPADAKIS